jgi:hypothetical protein
MDVPGGEVRFEHMLLVSVTLVAGELAMSQMGLFLEGRLF